MRVNSKMTEGMAKVNSNGQTVESTKVDGKQVNSMARVSS